MTFCDTKTASGSRPAAKPHAHARISQPCRLTLILGALAGCCLLVSCGNNGESASPTPAPDTNAPAVATLPRPELAKLLGKWQRPDGDYVLEVKGIDASGKMDV